MPNASHQYVCRTSDEVLDEKLFGDRIVRFLYSRSREQAPAMIRALSGPRMSSLLGFLNFDLPLAGNLLGNQRFLKSCGVDLSECVDPPDYFTTPRRIFERKIRYTTCRPMSADPQHVVSPADARVLVGSLATDSDLFLKDKFFSFPELLDINKSHWHKTFAGGEYAIFRLTPDKYHYNHVPVSGEVVDFYEIEGSYHSCNPAAVVQMVTPYSKNKRVVTIINTDIPGGSRIGLVVMIEIVALMIGQIVQCYSHSLYDNPQPVAPGLFMKKGQPKSLYRPGSSTTVLFFEQNRIAFSSDLAKNQQHDVAQSRFSAGFGLPLVETDVSLRSTIAQKI